jgi:NAD-dependent SIR2 family protein deacetylase
VLVAKFDKHSKIYQSYMEIIPARCASRAVKNTFEVRHPFPLSGSCSSYHLKDYRVSGSQPDHNDHRTGRRCLCGGILLDTIINFGEGLPEKELQLARDHANKADLCLVLGSSVSVTPACTIPEAVASTKMQSWLYAISNQRH